MHIVKSGLPRYAGYALRILFGWAQAVRCNILQGKLHAISTGYPGASIEGLFVSRSYQPNNEMHWTEVIDPKWEGVSLIGV